LGAVVGLAYDVNRRVAGDARSQRATKRAVPVADE
jgi:hypothetical protein